MEKRAIGIMSGTSLDGIDVVLASIQGMNRQTKIRQIAFETYPIDGKLKQDLLQAMDPKQSSVELICHLNVELAYAFSDAVISLCQRENIPLESIDFVASHGQTVYHITQGMGQLTPSSLQLGDGSVMAQRLKTTVVTNFRNADIAMGGQGAPLVPFVDDILFHSDTHTRVIHNIGGISNVTVMRKDRNLDQMIAFDTGPGNMMINRAMEVLYGKPYDHDGQVARSGAPIDSLVQDVLKHPYFNQKPPKSTGRELFGLSWTDQILDRYKKHSREDIVRSMTEIVIESIVKSYRNLIISEGKPDEIYFCGGGAHNVYLVERLKKAMPDIPIRTLDVLGYSMDAKEALAFIILANQTLHHLPSNVPHATGAISSAILGSISYGR